MKQQAGIGILLALTTAICWGALPIAMKQVLEVMEPPTIVFYRFLMASIGLGAILAVKKRLPPLRVFRKPRWLILLAVATRRGVIARCRPQLMWVMAALLLLSVQGDAHQAGIGPIAVLAAFGVYRQDSGDIRNVPACSLEK